MAEKTAQDIQVYDGSAWKSLKGQNVYDGSNWKPFNGVYDGTDWYAFGDILILTAQIQGLNGNVRNVTPVAGTWENFTARYISSFDDGTIDFEARDRYIRITTSDSRGQGKCQKLQKVLAIFSITGMETSFDTSDEYKELVTINFDLVRPIIIGMRQGGVNTYYMAVFALGGIFETAEVSMNELLHSFVLDIDRMELMLNFWVNARITRTIRVDLSVVLAGNKNELYLRGFTFGNYEDGGFVGGVKDITVTATMEK